MWQMARCRGPHASEHLRSSHEGMLRPQTQAELKRFQKDSLCNSIFQPVQVTSGQQHHFPPPPTLVPVPLFSTVLLLNRWKSRSSRSSLSVPSCSSFNCCYLEHSWSSCQNICRWEGKQNLHLLSVLAKLWCAGQTSVYRKYKSEMTIILPTSVSWLSSNWLSLILKLLQNSILNKLLKTGTARNTKK